METDKALQMQAQAEMAKAAAENMNRSTAVEIQRRNNQKIMNELAAIKALLLEIKVQMGAKPTQVKGAK